MRENLSLYSLFMKAISSLKDRKTPLIWRRNLRRLARVSIFLGFDPRRCFKNITGIPFFVRDWFKYAKSSPDPRFRVKIPDLFPILDERWAVAGTVGGHYFHQDLWAARKIYERRPERHVDIGSRIDGFVAHLLPFVPVTLIDVRPISSTLKGLSFIQDDATLLRNFDDCSVQSISSLHAAEHFGLGRYSDPIEPNACFRFMKALQRVVAKNGRLYSQCQSAANAWTSTRIVYSHPPRFFPHSLSWPWFLYPWLTMKETCRKTRTP